MTEGIQQRITEHLMNLVRIRSTADRPEELHRAVDYAVQVLQDLPAHRYESNGKPSVVFDLSGSKTPEVLFVGHLDVVPAEDHQFEPRIEGSRLWGRGALDMKGPDAVLLALFETLAAWSPRPPVALMLTTDEEVGGENGVGYLVNQEGWRARFGVIPDGGENFTIITEGKGVVHAVFTAHGKATHGSMPWQGDNALDKLVRLYETFRSRRPQEPCGDPEHWHETLTLGSLHGGDAPNRVPDTAEMKLDFRFPAPKTTRDLIREIEEAVAQVKGVEWQPLSTGEPFYTSPDNPHLQRFHRVAEEVLGRTVAFGKEHGATDGRFLAEKGIPCIILYPVGGGIHGPDEWVDLPSLAQLFRIFERFLQTLQP